MSKPKTLNDRAWEQLFDKYNIAREVERMGIFEITAKQINEFREARLMTKFDHRSNLPTLFVDNKLSILPITRGRYVIANFEAYHSFEQSSSESITAAVPDYIQSIDFENITSEAAAINVAYLSGILADFTGEENLYPTVNGRMSSESFDFNIYNRVSKQLQRITVSNSQLEIDGGYEGFDSLTLLEAKNSLSDDFLVRQLYYPYRLWKNKVEKPIKPVFLTYTNGIFSLYEYEFKDSQNYNSLMLVKQCNYSLEQDEITIADIEALLEQVKILSEPENIPFPQADNFRRVINICELLYKYGYLTRAYITHNYDFDIRQTNYYTDACRYLGLVYKEEDRDEGVKYFLTEKGKKIFRFGFKKRNLLFSKCILEKKAFNEVFKKYLTILELPDRDEIVKIMKKSDLYNVNAESTYKRRSSTISGWLNWLLDLTR